MISFLFFLIGLMLGGMTAIGFLCCLQIQRINAYEAEIKRLKSKLNHK